MTTTTISNPIMWADVPDPDVIRVGSSYYMVSTSMHSMPGCPIMKSEDLMHWEIVNYVYETFENNKAHRLMDGSGIYGKGSWAASLRHHEGIYYVCFSSNDMNQFYIYRTTDIEHGSWERTVFDGLYHDPALLFDDGNVYVIYGCGDIRIKQLTTDLNAFEEGGLDQLLLETEREGIMLRCEGCHAYTINGYYYLLFIEWPSVGNKRRRQVCYRSTELLGPYERKIVLDDDLGYFNKGIAQGAIIDTEAGDWYALLFQDHDAVGRIPHVLPVTWENGWPMIGIDGKAPHQFEVMLPRSTSIKPLVISDEFDYTTNELALNWQWNHNPDHALWSVTARPSHLRLMTGHLTDTVLQAPNTLTQRTEGPACTAVTKMDISHMKAGDHAGFVALQNHFGTVGIRASEHGERHVVMTVNDGKGKEKTIEKITYDDQVIHLKVHFNFKDSIDTAHFYYSADGETWHDIGRPLAMKYTLDHFMGYRIGLFNYAMITNGGFVDFDYFHYKGEQT